LIKMDFDYKKLLVKFTYGKELIISIKNIVVSGGQFVSFHMNHHNRLETERFWGELINILDRSTLRYALDGGQSIKELAIQLMSKIIYYSVIKFYKIKFIQLAAIMKWSTWRGWSNGGTKCGNDVKSDWKIAIGIKIN
jgi:hypothetical protein